MNHSATKRIAMLDEGQIFARIDKHELPDLDAVLLEMLEYAADETDSSFYWAIEDDEPTRLGMAGQASVKHRRISPCSCGDHGWHLDWVREDEDGMPNRSDGRGAFLAVMVE